MTPGWRPTGTVVLAGAMLAVTGLSLGVLLSDPLHGDGSDWSVPLALAGALGVGWGLWRLVLRPLAALADRAEALCRGDDAGLPPLAPVAIREVEAIGRSLSILERELRGQTAVQRSRTEHDTAELVDLLAVLRAAAEALARSRLAADERHRLLNRIDIAIERIIALLDPEGAGEALAFRGRCRIGPLLAGLERDHPGPGLILVEDAEVPMPAAGLWIVLDHLIAAAAAGGARRLELTARPDRIEILAEGGSVAEVSRDPGLPAVTRIVRAYGGRIVGDHLGGRIVIHFDDPVPLSSF